MPKEKQCISVVLNKYAKNYDDFTTDGRVLFCKFCECPISAEKKFQVTQHLQTGKHLSNKNKRKNSDQQRQRLLSTFSSTSMPGPKRSEFNEDLCKAFICADIPLSKLKNGVLLNFLERYTNESIPDESTLRKKYVPDLYTATITKLREKVKQHSIWIALDETTDVEQRCVANLVFGILGVNEERGKSYLLNLKELDKVNHSTIAAFFNDSLNLLWPDGILYEKVLLICSDAAPYMCKAMRGLKVLFPNMIHVTCLAHGLHRVADLVRNQYSEVNSLISSVKKIFLKAPIRFQKFRDTAGDIPFPPAPIITRWGTWIEAAVYYAENFEIIKKIVDDFDPEDSESIKIAQDTLKRKGLKEKLIFIKAKLSCISVAISKLEEKGLSIQNSIDIVEDVVKNLSKMKDKVFINKLNDVISKNTGYLQLKNIKDVLENKATLETTNGHLHAGDVIKFEFAPIVSCDVERIFSQYKNILADNRRKFKFDNLQHHVVVKCNFDLFI